MHIIEMYILVIIIIKYIYMISYKAYENFHLDDAYELDKLAPNVEMATSNGMITSPAFPITASANG